MRCGRFIVMAAILALPACCARAQEMHKASVPVNHIKADFPISDLDNEAWKRASEIEIATYWSGETAPAGRRFKARLLWSDNALYVRFEARQAEELVVSEKPILDRKTMNLWDRDVCEVFVAPDRKLPNKYYEFEVAPTGEWIDVGIEVTPKKRLTDWEYSSGMKSAARIEAERVLLATRIDWKAFGKTPAVGDIWLGNIFRCVGKDPTRGYLAWRPTRTATPNFHVPGAFGEFIFKK